MDDDTFAQKLLEEERVAVIPGSAFGARWRRLRALLLRHFLREARRSLEPHREFYAPAWLVFPTALGLSFQNPLIDGTLLGCEFYLIFLMNRSALYRVAEIGTMP
jgi:hypothetical protein